VLRQGLDRAKAPPKGCQLATRSAALIKLGFVSGDNQVPVPIASPAATKRDSGTCRSIANGSPSLSIGRRLRGQRQRQGGDGGFGDVDGVVAAGGGGGRTGGWGNGGCWLVRMRG